jgi:hypothetical protein
LWFGGYSKPGWPVGEAKRNRELARKAFLAEIENWTFEPTDWEIRTVEEIRSLPVISVQRYSPEQLRSMRMKPRECHNNAGFMETHDPEKKTKHVIGWSILGDFYVIHSVILRDGSYLCVTPTGPSSPDNFPFVPDPKIEWREEGGFRIFYRDNEKIGRGVRAYPAKAIDELTALKERLLSGKNPFDAVKIGGTASLFVLS